MRANDQTEATIISRREAIRRAALLAGVALSPQWLAAVGRTQPAGAKSYLPAPQAALLSAVSERILPRTDTPGAIDAGVPAFIDFLYGEVMTDAERGLLTAGLEAIEAAAKSAHGAAFTALQPAQQDAVMRTVATAQQAQKTPSSFGLIRSATILGYFTSEQVGKNVLNYDPVPGAYDGCIPIDQVGRRNWVS